ncbi:Bet v1-like protein [Diplocarpon rosae]|nr:Bet v1-like protein [Diplocarpon rosae]
MAALHEALRSLGPLDIADTPLDNLEPFLTDAFSKGQLLVDSVPIGAASKDASPQEGRSRASSSASSASEITPSAARAAPPPPNVESLQKEWKQVKMNPRDNPLGMSVYKLGSKDGKGAWFARHSVHEGLSFTKWKKGLEREFPETMKVQGGPGEGNIRGIGGERRVEYQNVAGVGKLEVYLLSAQFPGPTTPRDFVTMFMTSDQALSDQSEGDTDVPRHFMVISKPCTHPDTPVRDGYIRGQYESIEFIREISINKAPKKSASATNLPYTRNQASSTLSRDAILRNAQKKHSPLNGTDGSLTPDDAASEDGQGESRARGKPIPFDKSRGSDAKDETVDVPLEEDESECNPVEWIMITRSDPGGSVPRFMIERGTPGGIVSDASKFLDWACAKDLEEMESDSESPLDGSVDREKAAPDHDHRHPRHHKIKLQNYQTNGHLSGIEEAPTPTTELPEEKRITARTAPPDGHTDGGLVNLVTGVAGAAGSFIASHTPAVISENISHATSGHTVESPQRDSLSSESSVSSIGSFISALENYETANDVSTTESHAPSRALSLQDKELQKLEEKKRKIDEKLSKTREKELNKKSEDGAKEEEAVKKAEERHGREKRRQEEKYKKEVQKLERKRMKEEQKAEERRRKIAEKNEIIRLLRELEESKAEVGLLRKEREILRGQVGDLQAENTSLAARIGRLGPQGEEVLKDIRAEVGRTGRLRASSLKGLTVASSRRSVSKEKPGESVLAHGP